MRTVIFLIFCAVLVGFIGWGCAHVKVEAPKEPIKVDISMRLDIYQHVEKDIDEIEDIVSGNKEKPKTKDNESKVEFIGIAYAQEGFRPEVEEAALRRRDRRSELASWQENGIIGENRLGLVEIRAPKGIGPSLDAMVKEENNDRMIIYQALAEKNSVSVEEIQRIYAKRLQGDASSGTPIEIFNEATGRYEWRTK